MRRPIQVMKFGGTSVGDASCIERVVRIVQNALPVGSIAVVVSAMGGVTNRLIEGANQSKAGNEVAVAELFAQLRKQHDEAVTALIRTTARRMVLREKLDKLFSDAEILCRYTISRRELTPRTLDAISSLGERLCAPLVAEALAEGGVNSQALDATELVVTDSYHGGAEPLIELTRARCQARVTPLLQNGVVPVVTGFIGANEEGVLTTLGRGGSDYSATILGAALDADEVVIWSDVSGLLTADPRLVADACSIDEVSYREAAELAYFGAKVLHPKTLRPVNRSGIPIWIKSTFAPEDPGTKITLAGRRDVDGVKALAAVRDAALITISGPAAKGTPDALGRTVAAAAAVRADVLVISQFPSHNDICLVVASSIAERTVEALRREFSPELRNKEVEPALSDAAVSVITLVGENMRVTAEMVARASAALGQEDVDVLATSQGSSDCSLSFVVLQQDMKIALELLHRELGLGRLVSTTQVST
ncbi:MAG: aspartate kinase, partial [Terriglobales bacterium]